jgi:quercetin dioxygenase-like cupin family protein
MTNRAGEAGVQVLPLRGAGPSLPVLAGDGSARAVIWPGTGAAARSVHLIQLAPSSETVRLEHPAESVYYVLDGSGTVAGDGPAAATPLVPGSMVHMGPGTGYLFSAGPSGLEIVGGPCPPDPALYATGDGTGNSTAEAPAHVRAPAPAAGDGTGQHHSERSGSCEGTGAAAGDGTGNSTAEAPTHVRAPVPAGADGGGPAGSEGGVTEPSITVLHQDKPALMLPLISADARMIVWPGNGAWTATMNYVRMRPGEENSPHIHAESEDTIVILEGRGSIDDLTHGETHEFRAGDVIHVPTGLRHAVRANRGENVVSVGGPCPADLPFLRLCGAEIPERGQPASGQPRRHGMP